MDSLRQVRGGYGLPFDIDIKPSCDPSILLFLSSYQLVISSLRLLKPVFPLLTSQSDRTEFTMAQRRQLSQRQLRLPPIIRDSLSRCDWTDADLKAIAVLCNTEPDPTKHDYTKKEFRRFSRLASALQYTHQIETITANGITFNHKPPREINQLDAYWAYRFGEFTNRRGEYEDWKAYCIDSTAPLARPFQQWEFDFERSWFYMRVGKLRRDYPEVGSISMASNRYPRFPLDNSGQGAN